MHYLEFVERPSKEDEEYEEWEKRYDDYHRLPTSEKETFAHHYADNLRNELTKKGIIPFDKIENK